MLASIDIHSQILSLHQQAATSCHVGYKHALLIPNFFWLNVFVAVSDFLSLIRMSASLMSKCGQSHVGRFFIVRLICQVGEEQGCLLYTSDAADE